MLTDDAESIMLEVVFGDAPDDVVGLFFGRDDEVFGAGYVEGHGDDEHGALSRGLSFSPRLFTIFSAAILGAVRRRGRPFSMPSGRGDPRGERPKIVN